MSQGLKDFIDPDKTFPDTLKFSENSMLLFYQLLFSTFPPGKDCFHYDDNPDLSEISIQGRDAKDLESVDTRPKIVVTRGGFTWDGRGVGNSVGSSAPAMNRLSSQSRKFADINTGTVGVSCFSRNDLEADRIAQICFDSITMFRETLQRFGFLTIKASQVGARGLIKSDAIPELYVTPVLIQMQITRNWTLSKLDPVKLRNILLQLDLTFGGKP